jgi:hypothetical protein
LTLRSAAKPSSLLLSASSADRAGHVESAAAAIRASCGVVMLDIHR